MKKYDKNYPFQLLATEMLLYVAEKELKDAICHGRPVLSAEQLQSLKDANATINEVMKSVQKDRKET